MTVLSCCISGRAKIRGKARDDVESWFYLKPERCKCSTAQQCCHGLQVLAGRAAPAPSFEAECRGQSSQVMCLGPGDRGDPSTQSYSAGVNLRSESFGWCHQLKVWCTAGFGSWGNAAGQSECWQPAGQVLLCACHN